MTSISLGVVLLRTFFKSFINNGLRFGASTIERRRIRLINIFNASGAIVILIFFSINLIVGSTNHGFLILSGLLIVTFPVVMLNSKGRTEIAKHYLVIFALIFYNAIAYKSVYQFSDRDNGFFLIGFSTMIIALFDNPVKTVLFLVTTISAIVLKYVRIIKFSQADASDEIMSMTNLILGFICVYFFTDIFKNDLQKSEKRINSFANRLERQKFLVQSERDELIYNKQLIRRTIDNLPVFITMMDSKGKFIIVNSRFEKALQLSIEDIEGKNYSEILGGKIAKQATPLFNKCLTGVEVEIDYPISFPSGETIHAFGKYIPLVNSKGKVTYVLSFVTDIQKLKSTENQLREINSSKDKILSILSHDLRSPLNSLSGLLSYSDNIDPSVFSQMLKNLKRQVDVLSFTLDNVLSWVKTQLGGFVSNPQVVDLQSLVENSLDLYTDRYQEKGINMYNNLTKDCLVRIDRDHLDIVVRNLISNAFKFTPAKGKIVISSIQQKNKTKLSIKDSGIGMNKNAISMVMKGVGENKANTTLGTDGEKGTGLGLNFCLDILKLNGSQMKIVSGLDQGTEIIITIPAA